MNNGEACVAQTRILASRARYDEVVDALADAVGGDRRSATRSTRRPRSARCSPSRQRDRVEGYIAKGRDEGARLVTGGGRPAGFDKGWYVEPTIFADVDNTMTIAQEEIFGPVLSVIPYDDVDDAVRIANDSDYGLSGSVWTVRPAGGRRRRASGAHRHLRRQRHGHGLLVAVRWLQGLGPRSRARPRGPRRVPRVEDHRPARRASNLPERTRSLRVDVADVAPAGVQTLAVDIHLPERIGDTTGRVLLRARRRDVTRVLRPAATARRSATSAWCGTWSTAASWWSRSTHPAVGESDVPDDGYTLTPDVVADVNAHAFDQVLRALARRDPHRRRALRRRVADRRAAGTPPHLRRARPLRLRSRWPRAVRAHARRSATRRAAIVELTRAALRRPAARRWVHVDVAVPARRHGRAAGGARRARLGEEPAARRGRAHVDDPGQRRRRDGRGRRAGVPRRSASTTSPAIRTPSRRASRLPRLHAVRAARAPATTTTSRPTARCSGTAWPRGPRQV